MDQYITTIMIEPKNTLETKATQVTDDAMQPGGALARRLNNENPHWTNPVTVSVVAFQL